MTFAKSLLAVAAASVLSVGMAHAETKQATSLDQLLDMVKNNKIAESAEHREREARFSRQKKNQQRLLNKAEAEKVDLQELSKTLEQRFADNNKMIAEKEQQLDVALGDLKELFGHLTSTAGDLRGNLDSSIVSAQYPGRVEFVDDLIETMNDATELPSVADIEKLWFEMQRETIEAGKVAKFTTSVVQDGGASTEQQVTRIGAFNLVSQGKYLNYDAATGTVKTLTRQPSGGFLDPGMYQSMIMNLEGASSGLTQVAIDPTGPSGGSFLSALIDTPDLKERWHQGGVVGYIITGLGAFALLLAVLKALLLGLVGIKVKSQLKAKQAKTNNPLGRVLKIAENNKGLDVESLELKLEEAVLKERPGIESGVNLLKICSMVAPLLGLLGTVTGMIVTFQAITIFGAGDPKAMAGGISGALVTTVLGLLVAIPTVLLHTWVNGRAKNILHVLEEQSAGIIAENTEA